MSVMIARQKNGKCKSGKKEKRQEQNASPSFALGEKEKSDANQQEGKEAIGKGQHKRDGTEKKHQKHRKKCGASKRERLFQKETCHSATPSQNKRVVAKATTLIIIKISRRSYLSEPYRA